MIVLPELEQGTPEWMAARAGVVSASQVSNVITNTGKEPSNSVVTKYMSELAVEAVTGEKTPTFQSYDMKRGIEIEPEARDYFVFTTGLNVEEVGIVYKDETKRVSCSPDGLITEDGEYVCGLEIKCPAAHTHIEYLRNENIPTKYIGQVQASMYVTGFNVWYFMSYYPGVKPLIVKVLRDDNFIMALHNRLDTFLSELNTLKGELTELCNG